METHFEIAELNRRLANLIRIGTIAETNYSTALPKCRVTIGELKTDWLPITTLRAGNDRTSWHLEIGEQVLVLSPSGEINQGIVIGSVNQNTKTTPEHTADKHTTLYQDGAVIEYDRAVHHLKAILPDGATTQLISSGGVAIVGDVYITGNMTATGEITDHTRSMQADRDIYNEHDHNSPETGAKTSTPNATQ